MIARAFSFEVGLQFVVVRAALLRADPAHPGGIAVVAASEGESYALHFQVRHRQSRRYCCIQWPGEPRRIWRDEGN